MVKQELGKMIVIAGPDGSGKSTVARYLVELLISMGHDAIYTREPGGTEMAEDIRNVVLSKEHKPHIQTELLLMWASRTEHFHKLILPALAEGKIIVCDRFDESTYAYQAYPDNIQLQNDVRKAVLREFKEDFFIFMDVDFDVSVKRLNARSEESNRLDEVSNERRLSIFKGYHHFIENHEFDHFARIDANLDFKLVEAQVKKYIEAHFANLKIGRGLTTPIIDNID